MGYKKEIKIKDKVYPLILDESAYYVKQIFPYKDSEPLGYLFNLTPMTKEEAELEKDKGNERARLLEDYYGFLVEYSVVNVREAMLTSLYEDLKVTFYKGDLDYPISGVNFFITHSKSTLIDVCKLLRCNINKKSIIHINKKHKKRAFISALIYFCETEGIDWTKGLEIEPILKDNGDVDMIVNEIK